MKLDPLMHAGFCFTMNWIGLFYRGPPFPRIKRMAVKERDKMADNLFFQTASHEPTVLFAKCLLYMMADGILTTRSKMPVVRNMVSLSHNATFSDCNWLQL